MTWKYEKTVDKDGHIYNIAYNFCENCGKKFLSNNPFTTSYCLECAAKIRKVKNREKQRRFRSRQKEKALHDQKDKTNNENK